MIAETKAARTIRVDDAHETAIDRLDNEFSKMGPAPSPKKALNRMKAAIAKDQQKALPKK